MKLLSVDLKKWQLFGEIYLQHPTRFMIENHTNLLPGWPKYPTTVVIVLLFSEQLLTDNSVQVESEKKRLKEQFLNFGYSLRLKSLEKSYLIEIIDPQDGKPIYSAKGEISFDIVRVVHERLGFSFQEQNGCRILSHPTQKTAIYPSLLLSNTSISEIESLIEEITH